ncbi:thiamine-phosphate kinase [bacterium]|nr:thiamine-phosphate kinase [bacterium]
MNKEFEFLNIISNTLKSPEYLGDDCAYLKEFNLAISTDTLIEDVHFSLSYMMPKEIAKKALLVNVSDILAFGAMPKYATISLSGKLNKEFVENFYLGVREIEDEFSIRIIGGDLTKSDKIVVGVTIIGDCTNRNISSRKNAKDGYIVATVGEFGSSAQGLECLFNNIQNEYFTLLHKEPKLYPEISNEIAFKALNPYAMMDSSDGLIDCLVQISQKSNVKIDIEYEKISKKTSNRDFVLCGGEDYSLVVCLSEDDYMKIGSLTKIGLCSTGSGVFVDGKKIEYKGFKHFE